MKEKHDIIFDSDIIRVSTNPQHEMRQMITENQLTKHKMLDYIES